MSTETENKTPPRRPRVPHHVQSQPRSARPPASAVLQPLSQTDPLRQAQAASLRAARCYCCLTSWFSSSWLISASRPPARPGRPEDRGQTAQWVRPSTMSGVEGKRERGG
eukprot:3395570-Rhodomonas_salina.1